MSLSNNWYTVAEASSKFGVLPAQLLKWVEDGLVRSEGRGKTLLLDGNDIAQELNLIPAL